MVSLNFEMVSEYLVTWLQSKKSTNFKFVVRAKPELAGLVQSILSNYKHGIQ